jgi:hypothetical protein
VLDCPPALDLLTLNALVAADTVLIPMQAEYFALEGISQLLDTIGLIRQGLNPGLEVEGVVLTMYDERTNLAQQVSAELRNYFGDRLFTTTIPRNVRLAEAPSHGKPALLYDIRSRGAEAYIRLAKEIMTRSMAAPAVMAPVEEEVLGAPEVEAAGEAASDEAVAANEEADAQAAESADAAAAEVAGLCAEGNREAPSEGVAGAAESLEQDAAVASD